MAYRRYTIMDIWEIFRLWQAGYSIRKINKTTGYDRQKISGYIKLFSSKGINREDSAVTREMIRELSKNQPFFNERKKEKVALLENHISEIKDLIANKVAPVKPKTAFEIIQRRHNLEQRISYTTFKRFAKENNITKQPKLTTCRIEVDPGAQVQIDYAKAGLIHDPESGKRRAVYVFIGTLSYSRHKYVEYVFSQNQKSFVQSHINMFKYFGGVPKVITLDNLKSGVIKPDLYDPKLNRAYAEMAEYYGCFLDPCRVAKPKDKGKVERDVQTVREQFRKEYACNNLVRLTELNNGIINWLENHYGLRKHGTTKLKPIEEFNEIEKTKLLKLPAEPYEVSEWKEATVHPDHYIQVKKKAYSLPTRYVGEKLWVKVCRVHIEIYYNEELIKMHTIPKGFRQTDLDDFPENMHIAIDKGMPSFICSQARKISPNLGYLIEKILKPHAFINMRRAQGIISIAKSYPAEVIDQASLYAIDNIRTHIPKQFRMILNHYYENKLEEENQIQLSEETIGFVRSPEYFINKN